MGGELSIEGATTVTGGDRPVLGRHSAASPSGPGGELSAPGQIAIDLTNAEIRSTVTIGDGVRVRGTILLVGARVRGQLELDGVVLTDPDGHSLLKADGATSTGMSTLRGLQAVGGQLKFWRTTIGGGFDADRRRRREPGRRHRAVAPVRGARLGAAGRGFTLQRLRGAQPHRGRGRLDLERRPLRLPGAEQLQRGGRGDPAVAATFRGGMDLGWTTISPAINLTDATTTVLQDDPGTWPERIHISGFTYERFDAPPGRTPAGSGTGERRLTWLRRQPDYDASPYEQAARVFRQHGYEYGAEELLIAQRKHARRLRGERAAVCGRAGGVVRLDLRLDRRATASDPDGCCCCSPPCSPW